MKNQLIQVWFYILASPHEAKNYVYHATLKGESEKEISFCCQVRSLNESFKEVIVNQADTFMVGYKTAMTFRNEKNFLTYHFKLRSLKDEAKDDNEESGISDNDDNAKDE